MFDHSASENVGKVNRHTIVFYLAVADEEWERDEELGGQVCLARIGKIVRPTLRLWGESPHRVLLTRRFGLSVATLRRQETEEMCSK